MTDVHNVLSVTDHTHNTSVQKNVIDYKTIQNVMLYMYKFKWLSMHKHHDKMQVTSCYRKSFTENI